VSAKELNEECKKAMAAHTSWKAKFKKLAAGELKLEGADVRRSDACDFGKWLAGSGRALLGTGHGAIDAAHKHFHAAAASVVEAHNAGNHQEVEKALGLGGGFSSASAALINLVSAASR